MRNDQFADAGKLIVVPAWLPGPDDAAKGRYEMRTVTLPYYIDTRPVPDKSTAPLSEVERFMATNLSTCQLLAARITARQCQTNRANGMYLCGKCTDPMPIPPGEKKAKKVGKARTKSPWEKNPGFIPDVCRKSTFERLEAKEPEHVLIGVDLASGADETVIQVRSGQVRSGQVRSGQVRSGQVRSGQVRSGQGRRRLTPTLAKYCK